MTGIPPQDPAIGFLPYGLKVGPGLERLPVDRLNWPLGMPARLTGRCVGDLEAQDHLIVMPNTKTHFRRDFGTRAQVSMVVAEPSVVHRKHLALLRLTYRRFFRVLSYNEALLAAIPNGIFLPFGLTMVPDWRSLDLEKTRMVSLIASGKRDAPGHKLRHRMVDWARQTGQDITIMGRGYAPFEHKSEGLAPFRYSVVIENTRERNYISEKLIDAVLCDTVPIYWGCPNLDRFVDPEGIIQCTTEADLKRAIAQVSEADYRERLPGIRAMKPVLEAMCDYEANAARAIRKAIEQG
jgi:hypothetical protein